MAADTVHHAPTTLVPFRKSHTLCGFSIIGVFVGAMTAWSIFAPLGSAVIASGVVSVETHRKVVQHLEGGIIKSIEVKEGDRVAKGDVLVELRDVAARAAVERLQLQYYETIASVARLSSERDGAHEIAFPLDLRAAADQNVQARSALEAQHRLFASRKNLHAQNISILNKKYDRLAEERIGLKGQLEEISIQVRLSEEELRDADVLHQKRLLRKSRIADIRRERSRLQERLSATQSDLAQVEQQMSEIDLKKSELQLSILASIVDEIRRGQARGHELTHALTAAKDVLDRTRVRAPEDGTVVGIAVHARSSVIRPGQTLMEILPLTDRLVVDARIRPEDIEDVRSGLPVNLVLKTLSRRYSKPITGTLEAVSPDRLTDSLTGRAYYLAKVVPDGRSVRPEDTKLLAGMSAEVFIKTGERTTLTYLAAPLMRTIHHGMRER